MLNIGRVGLRRWSRQRRLFAALAAQTPESSSQPSFNRNQQNGRNKGLSLNAEQVRLQKKYGQSFTASDLKSIHDLIDFIEYRGQITGRIFSTAIKFITDSKENVAILSDRQISLLLSVFGKECDSVMPSQRAQEFHKAVKVLEERGAVLGVQSRNAILAARLDNDEVVNVVEELTNLEKSGLEANEGTYQQLARAYALQGNPKGVADIINHIKSQGMPVSDAFIDSLVYSLAVTGNYDQADSIVQKFSNIQNDVRLRSAVARAAFQRGDYDEVVSSIAEIPSSSKPTVIDNNKYILELFLGLLEKGQSEYADKLKMFLTTTPDGLTLAEWHANGLVLNRVRRLSSNGQLVPALMAYEVVYSSYKNSLIKEKLKSDFGQFCKKDDVSLENVMNVARRMEKAELIQNVDHFLLESGLHSSKLFELLNKMDPSDLISYLDSEDKEKRLGLSKKLSYMLTDKSQTSERKTKVLAMIATILLSPSKNINIGQFYELIYGISGYDADVSIDVIKKLNGSFKKEYSTAIVQQLLRFKNDPLASVKLNKILDSGEINQIILSRIMKNLEELLTVKEPKETQNDRIKLSAKLISLGFSAGKFSGNPSVKNLLTLLSNERLSVDKTRQLVDILEKESDVSLNASDLATAREVFVNNGQQEKSELLHRLKRNKTTSRWNESSLPELLKELKNMEKDEKYPADVASSLREVLCRRLLTDSDLSIALEVFQSITDKKISWVTSSSNLWKASFSACLKESRLDDARKLWEVKPRLTYLSADILLGYISRLYLSGDREGADRICEDLRSSAAKFTGQSLELVGRLLGSVELEKLEELSSYLVEKFNFTPEQRRRMLHEVKMQLMNKMIENKQLNEALQLAVAESDLTQSAFGHFNLFEAAFQSNNAEMVKEVHNMVRKHAGPNNAVLDTAFAMLQNGLVKEGSKILSADGIYASFKKLSYFIKFCETRQQPDVLHSLFSSLAEGERASTVDLNRLLFSLCHLYYKANDLDALSRLEKEIEKKSFPADEKIRRIFSQLEKQRQRTVSKS